MLKPLLLCLVLFGAAASYAQESQLLAALNPSDPASGVLNRPDSANVPELQAPVPASGDSFALPPSDDICYRIRAYIFKRDDDHAPQFVGSTTCGPRQPRARNAEWPKARLELLK